jgi:hypothetical protein
MAMSYLLKSRHLMSMPAHHKETWRGWQGKNRIQQPERKAESRSQESEAGMIRRRTAFTDFLFF